MDLSTIPDFAGIPPKLQLHLLTFYVLFKAVGTLVAAVRNGGGIKGIATAFWLGNPPKPPTDSSS